MNEHGFHRRVGRATIASGDARTAVMTRRYEAPIEDVWDACTVPDRLNRWFLQVTGDLREGGEFALAANAHGRILRCEPPRLLVLSWIYGDRPADQVTLHLREAEGGGTELELEHATVLQTVEWDGKQVDVVSGIGEGWELPIAYYLEQYLRGELPDAPSSEWYAPTDEDAQRSARAAEAWAALV